MHSNNTNKNGKVNVPFVLGQLFSDHQYYRLFYYYFHVFCKIGNLNNNNNKKKNDKVIVGGRRESFSPKSWLVDNLTRKKENDIVMDVSDLAMAFDSIISYVVKNPPFSKVSPFSEFEKQIFEFILEYLFNFGFKGAGLSNIKKYIVGKFNNGNKSESSEETLHEHVEAILLANSSNVPGEASLFYREKMNNNNVNDGGDDNNNNNNGTGVYVLSEFVNNKDDIFYAFNDVCMSAKLPHLLSMVPIAPIMTKLIANTTFINHFAIGNVNNNFNIWCTLDLGGNSALHIIAAIFDNNVESSSSLINNVLLSINLNLNQRNKNGHCPLHISCALGQYYGIQSFLKNGANADLSVLKFAISNNTDISCLKKLLELSCIDPDIVEKYYTSIFNAKINKESFHRKHDKNIKLLVRWYMLNTSWPWTIDNKNNKAQPTIVPRMESKTYLVRLKKPLRTKDIPRGAFFSAKDIKLLANNNKKSGKTSDDLFIYEDSLGKVLKSKNIGFHTVALDMTSEKVSKHSSPDVSKRKTISNEQNQMLKAAICTNEVNGVLSMIIRGANVIGLEKECIEKSMNQMNQFFRQDGNSDDLSYFDRIASTNSSNSNQFWMPLHFASYSSNEDMVRLLIGNGANINGKNVNGQTPLHCISMLSMRVDLQINSKRGRYRSDQISEEDIEDFLATEEVIKLIEKETLNKSICTTFALLELGANANVLDKYGISPLHIAAQRGDHKLASLLLLHGGDPTIICGTDAYETTQENDAIDKVVVRDDGNFPFNGMSSLHIAVMEEYIPIIGAILFNPPLYGLSSEHSLHNFIMAEYINVIDTSGRTAFFYAVTNYNPSITGLLANAGADLNLKDNEEVTCIDMIDYNYETSIGPWGKYFYNLLISNGVQLSPKSTSGKHKKYANQLNEARRVFEIRTIKQDEYNNKSSANTIDERVAHPLVFWAEPKLSPICFSCIHGHGDTQMMLDEENKNNTAVEQFHCFYCGLLYCNYCSYSQIDNDRTFPKFVETSNGDQLKAKVCKSCILLLL